MYLVSNSNPLNRQWWAKHIGFVEEIIKLEKYGAMFIKLQGPGTIKFYSNKPEDILRSYTQLNVFYISI